MPQNYRTKNFDLKQAIGQFILTAETPTILPEWPMQEFGPWRLYTQDLPVVPVYDEAKRWLGWCIGHLILDGRLHPDAVVLRTAKPDFDMDVVDDFYQRAAGKWALLLVAPGYDRVFLDPYGSLATVYSTSEKTVASTPSLIGTNQDWNETLLHEINFPTTDIWLPSGLTAKKNVRRLLPNHCLHLADWTVARHWPTPQTDLSVDPDTKATVSKIVGIVKSNIAAVAEAYPLCFTITAGRDSRSVLACAQNYLEGATFITFAGKPNIRDMQIPALMVRRLNLNHRFIHPVEANAEELEQWLDLTGRCVSGRIWVIHKTLGKLDPTRVLLPGTSAEMHKGIYHRTKDQPETKITTTEVLNRCMLPHHPAFVEATEAWLRELHFLNAFHIMDLLHLEQRLGCWAGPQHYGNTTSAFEMSVFNSRPVFHAMMRLPEPYRQKKQLATDICQATWPELTQFPFNEYTGIKGLFFARYRKMKKRLGEIIRR